jgi:cell division septation protein DedD
VTQAPTTSTSPPTPTTSSHEKAPQKLGSTLVQPTSSGRYLLNLGSFSSHSNAQRRVDQLRKNGVPADVAQGTKSDGTPVYRVRVAYFEGHSLAKAYGEDLKRRLGLDYWISER